MKKPTWILLAVGLTIFPGIIAATDFDGREATLQCWIGGKKDSSLFIFSKEKKVYLSDWYVSVEPLAIDSFLVVRCPFCYSFSGSIGGQQFEGQTEGRVADPLTKTNTVLLNLSVDKGTAKQFYCSRPW